MRLRILGPAGLAVLAVLSTVSAPQAAWTAFPAAGSLSPATPMFTARAAHTATSLPDGTVLIAGGFAQDREGNPFAETEVFDPDTDTFTPVAPMSTGRQSHTASMLPDGRVLIVGGFGRRALNTTEIFDPSTGQFEPGTRLVRGRASHGASELPDGRVLVSGGQDASGNVLASIEIFDPATGDFATAGSLATPRVSHTQTVLGDGTVLVVGGTSGRRADTQILASAEIFDPTSGKSTVVAQMTTPRYKHAAVLLRDGRVLVVAGSDDRDWNGQYDTAEIYDPKSRTFSETTKLNRPRFKLRTAVVRLTDGRVLIAGGTDTVELFDPVSHRFELVDGSLGSPWFFATASALPDGRALIAGGYDRRIQSTSRAWIYTP